MDHQLDLRLVRTFERLLEVLVLFQHRNHDLLLSVLGTYLLGPDQAPAGAKRLSNLLRSAKWEAALIGQFLWRGASDRIAALQAEGEEARLLWDESVLEKPGSSKAVRLQRIKPGFYRPPGAPVFVPDLPWASSWWPVSGALRPWRSCAGGATAPAARSRRRARRTCAGSS